MKFQTADICDQYGEKVDVVDPIFTPYGGVTACYGKIVTIKLDEDNSGLITLLKSEGNGRIAVVDAQGKFCAIVGDTLMGYAHKNNWAGIVVNGYVRDVLYTKNIQVGLWALGTCPKKSSKKAPFVVGAELFFANASFKEGTFLYADLDGIILSQENLLK